MTRKNKNKKWRIGRIVLTIIIILLIILGVSAGRFISNKLSNLNIQEIDTSDLAINSDLYNAVSDVLTRSEFKNVICIALFGTDSRDTDNMGVGRSDTIIIAAINAKFKTIKLISIPRDTYVEVEGYGKTKINHAYAYGGEQLAIKTINQNFGLSITEYATIDFSGLIHIINNIGGIQINISKSEMEYINKSSINAYQITGNTTKKLSSYGNVKLDGEQALAHSRNRTVGNDFTRAERQREVLEAIINKMVGLGTSKILDLSDGFLKEIKTNINVTNYLGQLTNIIINSSEYMNNVTSLQIPSTEYGKGQTINGTYYFVANKETIKQDMIDNIYRK